MPSYSAPLRDIGFVVDELLAVERSQPLTGCEEFTPDLVNAVLEEAGRFCTEVLHPLNQSGDEEGCRLENGVVRTPQGFAAAYQQLVAGGWVGLSADPEDGGQGLPEVVGTAVSEMMYSTNLAFAMYPSLTIGAYNAVRAHGDETLRAAHRGHLCDGSWRGPLCLARSHCGTDLGMIRTRATPLDDGSYRINGNKIFISAGEHDMAENIVHLVLARLPDAPAGTHGISLFLVPKFIPGDDGDPGQKNGVACSALEHKMGIRASATCVLDFDDAQGWLVGQPNRGLAAMFTMMNAARLAVGIQGLGLGEVSYQNAVAYARGRTQGRGFGDRRDPGAVADPILAHADVRRMLLTMRAWVEGGRMLALWTATQLDAAQRHPDADVRVAADDLVSLMTPVVKAMLTDLGTEITNLGMQVFGGHGYIRDHGMEQFVRDARIGQIYEGTNGVQAMDLVGRKLPAHGGRYLRRFFHPLAEYLESRAGEPRMAPMIAPLGKAFGRLQRATAFIAERGMRDPNEAGAAAADYLRLLGLVAMGYLWARAVETAAANVDGPEARFYRAKLDTARFFFARLLPQSSVLFAAIVSGAKPVMEFDDEAF